MSNHLQYTLVHIETRRNIIKYIKASRYASERLHELSICNRLLKETHEILMQDVRRGDISSIGPILLDVNINNVAIALW